MTSQDHEQAFVSAFVVSEQRTRYAEFLPKPKHRVKITDRFCHKFDFVPKLAKQVPRTVAPELAKLLRKHGAGDTAYVIGGRDAIDGQEFPLEEAIDAALADPAGVVISCVPGQLALLIQEFPPGDVYLLSRSD